LTNVCQQLHAIVSLLDAFKAEQQPLELVFLGKGPFDPHPQRMDGWVEEAFASTLGRLAVARIFLDVGDEARIENVLAIAGGIKATIKVDSSLRLHSIRFQSRVAIRFTGDI
jgi:hypothetical protein